MKNSSKITIYINWLICPSYLGSDSKWVWAVCGESRTYSSAGGKAVKAYLPGQNESVS